MSGEEDAALDVDRERFDDLTGLSHLRRKLGGLLIAGWCETKVRAREQLEAGHCLEARGDDGYACPECPDTSTVWSLKVPTSCLRQMSPPSGRDYRRLSMVTMKTTIVVI